MTSIKVAYILVIPSDRLANIGRRYEITVSKHSQGADDGCANSSQMPHLCGHYCVFTPLVNSTKISLDSVYYIEEGTGCWDGCQRWHFAVDKMPTAVPNNFFKSKVKFYRGLNGQQKHRQFLGRPFFYCLSGIWALISCRHRTHCRPPEELFSFHSEWQPVGTAKTWLLPKNTLNACHVVSHSVVQCNEKGNFHVHY